MMFLGVVGRVDGLGGYEFILMFDRLLDVYAAGLKWFLC